MTTSQRISECQRKLQELILYISMKSEADERFGKVKLNKLLFYCDFTAFLRLGKPITGVEYQALQNGPAPKVMLAALRSLEETSDIAIRKKKFFGREQQKVFAFREPDLDCFSTKEIALIDSIIANFWPLNGSEISDVSHSFTGWKLAKEGETIPYEAVLVERREPTIAELEYGKSLEGLAKQCLAQVH